MPLEQECFQSGCQILLGKSRWPSILVHNEKILAFQYKITEGWDPLEICERVDPADPPKPHISRSWWPEDVPANAVSTPRHAFYTCENGDSYLAAHPKVGQAFYWNTKL